MAELWYPPNFTDWPAEACGAWYSVNATREEAVNEIRTGVDIENPDESKRLNKEDLAAAVEKLSDGDRVLRVDNSLSACLSALADEVGLERDAGRKLSAEQLGIVASLVRDELPTSPYPVRRGW